jgi:hypothetical protein
VPLGDLTEGHGVAGQGVEDGVPELTRVECHLGADLGEGRDDQPGLDGEPLEVRRQAAQPVDDRVRRERPLAAGQGDERLGVEGDVELLVQRIDEGRVEERLAEQLDLEVAAVASDRERAQQDRGAVVVTGVRPGRDADGQVHGVDAAHGGQLEALGRDLAGRQSGGAQREVVADQARQEGRLAGDELGETARVGRAQLDAGTLLVTEVQQGRSAADLAQLLPPDGPDGLGRVADRQPWITEAHGVRGVRATGRARRDDHGTGSVVVVIMLSVGAPHT